MGSDRLGLDFEHAYHVITRGCNRGPLAWDSYDFDSLYFELDRAATRHRWDVLSWCFLHNHYHLIVRTPQGGFSDGFRVMNGTHARRTNLRHGRTDHLFRNRPRAYELASDAHLVSALLYVARNPVAAGVCADPGQWPHASYRALAGAVAPKAWLVADEVLGLFGGKPERARAEFARLVCSGHLPVSDDEWELFVLSP
jgi:putative transposase